MKCRRLVLFLFCVIMAVTLCGCNNSQELSKDHTEDSKTNNEIIQLDIDVIKDVLCGRRNKGIEVDSG